MAQAGEVQVLQADPLISARHPFLSSVPGEKASRHRHR